MAPITREEEELIEKRVMDRAYDAFVQKGYCMEHHQMNAREVVNVKRLFFAVILGIIGILGTLILNMQQNTKAQAVIEEKLVSMNSTIDRIERSNHIHNRSSGIERDR